jgi:hypothetical protein
MSHGILLMTSLEFRLLSLEGLTLRIRGRRGGMNYSPYKFCHIVITHSEKHGATKGSVPVMPKPMRVKENRSSILETRFMQSYQSPSFLCYVDPRIGREKLCKNIPMIWPPL